MKPYENDYKHRRHRMICKRDLLRLAIFCFVSSIRTDIKAHTTNTKCRCLFHLAQIFVTFMGIISNLPWLLFPKRHTCKCLHWTNVNTLVTIPAAVLHQFICRPQRCVGENAAPSNSWTYGRGYQKTAFADPTKACNARGHFMGKNAIKILIVGSFLRCWNRQ